MTDIRTETEIEKRILGSAQIQAVTDIENSSTLTQNMKRQRFLQEIMENSFDAFDLDGNVIEYKPFILTGPLPKLPIKTISIPFVSTETIVPIDTNELTSHDLLDSGVESAHRIYYITDLHIEHKQKRPQQ